jgi:hypothetical protein
LLAAVETALTEAIEQLDVGDTAGARDVAGQALDTLRRQLPPQFLPLGEFRITSEEDR